jgi:hypothetical protein
MLKQSFKNVIDDLLNPLVQVFEAMMEKRQDQIPDEGFLMTKKKKKKKSKQRPNTETVCADIPCIAVKTAIITSTICLLDLS